MTLNSSAFQHLRNSVEALIAEGVFAPGDPTIAALQLMTAAHGVAALLISKPYLPWGDIEISRTRRCRRRVSATSCWDSSAVTRRLRSPSTGCCAADHRRGIRDRRQ